METFKLKVFCPSILLIYVTDKCRNCFQPINELNFYSRNENQAQFCVFTPKICTPPERQEPSTNIMNNLFPLLGTASRVVLETFPSHPFSAAVIVLADSYRIAELHFPSLRTTVNTGKLQC